MFIAESCHCHSNLLETGAVDPNVIVDKYCPTPALVRACEDGRAEFAEALLKYGANVSNSLRLMLVML